MNKYSPCPCHSNLAYAKCCKSYHEGSSPPTALALMRSRYAAYAMGLIDYVIQTTHENHPHYQSDFAKWRRELFEFHNKTRFRNLTIVDADEGPSRGSVTFTASLVQGNSDVSFSEKSGFVRENGRWLYESTLT